MNWFVALIVVVVIVAVALVLKFVLGISFALMSVIFLGLLGGMVCAVIRGSTTDKVGDPITGAAPWSVIFSAWGIGGVICAAIAAWWIYF